MVKPQEVNQARLFAIDTRLKETEDFRVREIGFMKDVFRKLIYALEQTEVQKSLDTQNSYLTPSTALVPFVEKLPQAKTVGGGEEQAPLPKLMGNKTRAHSQVAHSSTQNQGLITSGKGRTKDAFSGATSPDYPESRILTPASNA